jgi:rhodanese-related sulfurtransferase
MSVPEVSATEGAELVEEGAVLLDVRNDDEWAAGHAPDAQYLTLGELVARIGEVPADRQVVVICRSGSRSARAVELLAAHGYDAVNVFGGMQAWAAAGLPVFTDAGRPGEVI